MNQEILIFNDIVVHTRKFKYAKNPIWKDDVDVDKTLISNNVSFGKNSYKCFIGYKDNEKKYSISYKISKYD